MPSPLRLAPSTKDWLQPDSEDDDDPTVSLRQIRAMKQQMQTLQEGFRQKIAEIRGKAEVLEGQKEGLVQKINRKEKHEQKVLGAIRDMVQQAEEAVQEDVESGIDSSARECLVLWKDYFKHLTSSPGEDETHPDENPGRRG